ncbi:DUF3836 domain-containing protein [Bacteroides helcogenes]|uniref:DUF3836 domain-containing protein n=1 Tax=Bacteroides helcogenes (strain ATCC 35417 / DSM 20613 / JCM 6297 / CCUG 15421 / P 36-108) TaxID=693979 RepID=E6SQL1_BACT6|nr:DUF3836 domain-containing protein [Bacteroides helcogenes]ADV42985.1 hypothetical protein Bache_0971 [Bacteroides helcogenes P 36-108]MDY5236972.1 DUF3836 domain-containing protein [Bacteroides helcogenes]
MKTLVMTAIFAMTAMVNALAGNEAKNFAYNTETDGSQVKTQTVYKLKDGKFLENHLKYSFEYDAQGRVVKKEALKWNETDCTYERYFCLNYNYTEAGVDVVYALWNKQTNSYGNVKEKAVYMQEGVNVNYQSYRWNEKEGSWNMLVEHRIVKDEDVRLIANR